MSIAETIQKTTESEQGISQFLKYVLISSASLLCFLYWRQRQSRLYQLGNKIPGPPCLPFFGNALLALTIKGPHDIVTKGLNYAKQYGTVIRAFLGPYLYVFLTDADDIEAILNSTVHIDKPGEYDYFRPWLGDGLLISNGDKWRVHRKIIAPTFHINILKSFVDVFNMNATNVVEKMKTEMGKTFDVHDYMSGVTVDILLETAMGITRKTQGEDSGYKYAMAVMKMCDIVQQRQLKFWLRLDSFFKFSSLFNQQIKLLDIIHGLTKKVLSLKKDLYLKNRARGIIPQTIEELTREPNHDTDANVLANENKTLSDTVFGGYRDDLDFNDDNDIGQKKRLAFLDLLIESSQSGTNKLTDHEIKEEVDTIMFEGHDTTAAGSSFFLCLLGVHQNIQERVYEELYSIFGDSDRPCTFADTLEMKYLERTIFEALRMFPPVPIVARKLNQDVKISTNDYILPADSTVIISTFSVHRNPKYYRNPNVFDPDNFLAENTQNRHYYSFVPFSAGPRSCVGRKYALLKLKVLLSTILRNFRMVSDIPEDQFQLQADIILKRTDGFRVNIEPRIKAMPKIELVP